MIIVELVHFVDIPIHHNPFAGALVVQSAEGLKIRKWPLMTAGCHQRKFAGDSRLSPANFRW